MTIPEVPTTAEIVHARSRLRMTQSALASRLGVDVMTVSRWERGETAPPPYLALALDHLGCVSTKPAKRK